MTATSISPGGQAIAATASASRHGLEQCELVKRTQVIDRLHHNLVIRSADGSEVTLHGYHISGRGEFSTSAEVSLSKHTKWNVEELAIKSAEARFRRDAEVAVGEPFGMLLYCPPTDRRVWINFGRVEAIGICPSSES